MRVGLPNPGGVKLWQLFGYIVCLWFKDHEWQLQIERYPHPPYQILVRRCKRCGGKD